jgi:hypothetical protein
MTREAKRNVIFLTVRCERTLETTFTDIQQRTELNTFGQL